VRTLVAGFGNVLRGDDGFGVAVIRRLQETELPLADVELMEVGTAGIRLAQELLTPYDRLIIVDAMARALKLPESVVIARDIAYQGNTSAASIPLAAWAMLESGEAKSGDNALFIAFGAIPRMVLGPVLVMVEGVTFFLVRQRIARALLAAAMLMDLVPLGMDPETRLWEFLQMSSQALWALAQQLAHSP
jgi:hydrogenase maturation protease